MTKGISKVVLLVALLSTFVATGATAFTQASGDRVCGIGFKPTDCVYNNSGGCSTQRCKDGEVCSYTFCDSGKGF